MNFKSKAILFLCCFAVGFVKAQIIVDTIPKSEKEVEQVKFKCKSVLVPTVLIGFGIIGLENEQIKSINSSISNEVIEDIDSKTTIDDFTQYTPMVSVYALSALGVKSKNNYKDRTIILATSYLLMGITVNAFKQTASVERPDGTSFNSFPSGHTATAFMGAEMMMQEYKNESIWYGIGGYVIATGTGLFRMYNNRHWLTDVAAGAGIGILSTKAGYWLFPYVSKIFKSNKNKNSQTVFIPSYNGKQVGFGLVSKF